MRKRERERARNEATENRGGRDRDDSLVEEASRRGFPRGRAFRQLELKVDNFVWMKKKCLRSRRTVYTECTGHFPYPEPNVPHIIYVYVYIRINMNTYTYTYIYIHIFIFFSFRPYKAKQKKRTKRSPRVAGSRLLSRRERESSREQCEILLDRERRSIRILVRSSLFPFPRFSPPRTFSYLPFCKST